VAGIPGEVQEVTHALERGPAVGDIARVQASERILARQALQQRRVQIQRHDDFIAPRDRLGHEQLLVCRAAARRMRQAPAVGDQEVVHVVRDAHVVDAADEILQPRQQHGQCVKAVPPARVGSTPRRFSSA
jgi:hypothetical protein